MMSNMPDLTKETYANTRKFFHWVVRVPKNDSAYLYFTFEASEGIAMYSTLPESEGTSYRDIDFKGPIEYLGAFEQIMETLKKQITWELLEKSVQEA